eukprot:jgi/Tetstr1/427892/TSEL_017968.t1
MDDDDFWADEENEEQVGHGGGLADHAVGGNNESTEDIDGEHVDEDEDEDGGDEDEGGDEEDEGEGDEEHVDYADGSAQERRRGRVAASTAIGGKAQDSPAPTENDEVDKALSDISNTLLGVKGSLTSQVVHIKEAAS